MPLELVPFALGAMLAWWPRTRQGVFQAALSNGTIWAVMNGEWRLPLPLAMAAVCMDAFAVVAGCVIARQLLALVSAADSRKGE